MQFRVYQKFLIIGLLLFLAAWLTAADSTATDREMVQMHQNLLKMEKAGISNADLFNQLGLSYYKQGETGKAVLNFLRALRINSNHKAARNNLNYMINQALDKEMYTQPSFLPDLFQKIFNFFSLKALALIVLLMLLITTLCLHWLMHLPTGQDKAVTVMWLAIFGFILLLSVTMLGFKYRGYLDTKTAVVTSKEVEGYSGPGPEFGKLFTVHEGLIVHISRVDNDWALVTLPNGGAGWLASASLQRVKP